MSPLVWYVAKALLGIPLHAFKSQAWEVCAGNARKHVGNAKNALYRAFTFDDHLPIVSKRYL